MNEQKRRNRRSGFGVGSGFIRSGSESCDANKMAAAAEDDDAWLYGENEKADAENREEGGDDSRTAAEDSVVVIIKDEVPQVPNKCTGIPQEPTPLWRRSLTLG